MMQQKKASLCWFILILLTIRVVHLEQEGELLLLPLVGELVHGLQELLQGDCPASILVKNTKSPLHKEFLKILL